MPIVLSSLIALAVLSTPQYGWADHCAFVGKHWRDAKFSCAPEKIAAKSPSAATTRVRPLHGDRASLAELARLAAERHGVDPRLVGAVIAVESDWNPRAVSPRGAIGLMQLMPKTAARFGVRDIFDPHENVDAGTRYLRFLLDLFGGNVRLALAAYNAGEEAVTKYGGIPPYAETQAYVPKVLSFLR